MVCCDRCGEWFHPRCIKLTINEVKMLDRYTCDECTTEMLKAKNRYDPEMNTKVQIDLWNGIQVKKD
ncbi:hypothetical protein AQUCO_01500077v1 [Aquilegia coerulea]|uniref:PHD-type domain-containing protein n=1 Tax=Aquilegia coerulea TaxID=218851 RepID=A0A2G5DS07_AQUCA|nr:hypothetical protein AQUCO_01500077v1 [Aquilegia coerulea]